jgi:hypothetical protein
MRAVQGTMKLDSQIANRTVRRAAFERRMASGDELVCGDSALNALILPARKSPTSFGCSADLPASSALEAADA